MYKLLYLSKIKAKPSDSGFITLEIIVSTLIAFFFLIGSLQALVLGTMLSVGARDDQRGDKLIQEAIEELNDLGSSSDLDLADDPTSTVGLQAACSGNFNGTTGDGYGQALWNLVTEGDATVTSTSAYPSKTDTRFQPTLTLAGTQIVALGGATSPTPHRILGMNYVVTDPDGNTIANRYVEIIPDAALECS